MTFDARDEGGQRGVELGAGELLQGTVASVAAGPDWVRVEVVREVRETVRIPRGDAPEALLDAEAAIGQAVDAANVPIGSAGVRVTVREPGSPEPGPEDG